MKKYIPIAIVVLAVLFFGCTGVGPIEPSPGNPLSASDCTTSQDQGKRNLCYMELAIKNQDIGICSNLDKQDLLDDCYFWVATAKKDSNLCDKITLQTRKDDCYLKLGTSKVETGLCEKLSNANDLSKCYKDLAFKTNNLSLCDKLAGQLREQCYYSIATAKQDADLCLKTGDTLRQEECYSEIGPVRQDLSICQKIKSPYQYGFQCRASLLSLKDVSFCENTSFGFGDECYALVAILKSDPTICNNIDDYPTDSDLNRQAREKCEEYFSRAQESSFNRLDGCDSSSCRYGFAVADGDLTICDGYPFSVEEDGKSKCYSAVAISKADNSICKKLNQSYHKNYCLNALAMARKDASVCEEISLDYWKASCRSDVMREKAGGCANTPEGCYSASPPKSDLTVCEKIRFANERDACYYDAAKSSNDRSICLKITDDSKQNQCYWEFGAVNMVDSSTCDGMPTWSKDDCYSRMAQQKKDASICSKISNATVQETCRGIIGSSISGSSSCDSLSAGEARDQCYYKSAEKSTVILACEKIQSSGWKDDCLLKVAENRRDADTCLLIKKNETMDNCYLMVGQATKDPNVCLKAPTSRSKDSCYAGVAPQLLDSSLCDRISDQYSGDNCYANVAPGTGNLSLCDKIGQRDLKDICYSTTLLVGRAQIPNIQFCDGQQSNRAKESCYARFGGQTGDLSICNKIPTLSTREFCFSLAAKTNKDGSLCDKISDSSGKGLCLTDVANLTKNSSLCEGISWPAQKSYCQWLASGGTPSGPKTISDCGAMQTGITKDSCYAEIATSAQNFSICALIGPSLQESPQVPYFRRYSCYLDIARVQDSLEACDKIPDEAYRGECYITYGQKRDDDSGCSRLSDSTAKTRCFEIIQNLKLNISDCGKINDSSKRDYCYYNTAMQYTHNPADCENAGAFKTACYSQLH
jgi:hypothetical protein